VSGTVFGHLLQKNKNNGAWHPLLGTRCSTRCFVDSFFGAGLLGVLSGRFRPAVRSREPCS
jgi:hypothetical protein